MRFLGLLDRVGREGNGSVEVAVLEREFNRLALFLELTPESFGSLHLPLEFCPGLIRIPARSSNELYPRIKGDTRSGRISHCLELAQNGIPEDCLIGTDEFAERSLVLNAQERLDKLIYL